MRRIAAALAVTLMSGTAVADDRADAVATAQAFVDGFNKGNVKASLATCASPSSVVDEFPPYAWQGPTGCADWATDFDANAKKEGITPGDVTLSKPRHAFVSGDRAYLVFPAKYAYAQKGKKVTQKDATMTVALQKQAGAWKITGWAWSTGK
jgi:hypothetical protein